MKTQKRSIVQVEELTTKETEWLAVLMEECSVFGDNGGDCRTRLPHYAVARRLNMAPAYWKKCFVTLSKKFKGLSNYLTWLQMTEHSNLPVEFEEDYVPATDEETVESFVRSVPGGDDVMDMLTKKQLKVLSVLCSGLPREDVLKELGMRTNGITEVLKNIERRIPGIISRLDAMDLLTGDREPAPTPFTKLPCVTGYEKTLDTDGVGADFYYTNGERDRAIRKM